MRVFLYEAFDEEADLFRKNCPPGIEIEAARETIQETGHDHPGAPVISIRTQSRIPAEWADQLQAVLTRSTGYDHIAAYLKQCGRSVPCGYLPHYCSRSVAEQAMMLWLALLRKLPRQIVQFRTFARDGLTGREAQGAALLVVGVGKIGHEVVCLGNALQMTVLGVDIVQKHSDVAYVSIDEGLAAADVIVSAMNLNSGNRGYFNKGRLSRCKPGAVFVNVSRGELSPAEDLLSALKAGQLGGVALDVFNGESALAVELRAGRRAESPEARALAEMAELPNVIFTPHNAFNTSEATHRKVLQSYEQLAHFQDHGVFLWNVGTEY